MSNQVDAAIRSREAFNLARAALNHMEQAQVWPTPLNFELWLHLICEPDGAIGQEITRLITQGAVLTDAMAEEIAVEHLPRLRLNDEIRDASDHLTEQMVAINRAISLAQISATEYGRTLEGASRELAGKPETGQIRHLIETLSISTRRVQKENATLESRLDQTTEEIKRLRSHLEQVRRDAMTDALTSLSNRKAFDDELKRACEAARAEGKVLSVAIIDIDHFKRFNDTWGHQAGDQVIRYVAAMIANACPQPRFAARYGGEEFAILFPNEGVGAVHKLIEAMCKDIASRSLKRRSTAEELGTVTVSAGVAELHRGELPSDVVERADSALYASKRNGRNRTTNAEALAA